MGTTTNARTSAEEFADRFVVVLNRPEDVVNIAGTVRAMMNMGLRRLRLVRPAEFNAWRITGIAHGSEAVVEAVEIHDTLDDALADAAHVVGTTARRRTAPYVWQHPREAAPELLELAAGVEGPVVLLFGPESMGLTNEELDRCDRVLTVPTSPSYSSLNLAQAVLLICYELWLAGPGAQRELPRHRKAMPPASPEDLEALFRDVERSLDVIEFFKTRNPRVIMRSVRAIARRAALDSREARLLRAMAIEVRKFIERREGRGEGGGEGVPGPV